MSKTDFTLNDAIGWQFEKWWDANWPNGFAKFLQAKDYAEAAYRAGYKTIQETIMSNSSNPVPTPEMQELLTRDQRDALCAANAFLVVLQAQMWSNESVYPDHRIQKVINVISDMLYK